MSDPNYKRTTKSRNAMNRRAYRPLEVQPHCFVDTRLRRYVEDSNGVVTRVKGRGEK